MKHLNVKPFRQSPNYCGPACLKMVLEYYGIHKSEKELVKLTKCTKSRGTNAENIILAAKKSGLSGSIKDYSTFNDIISLLKKDIPVIVDWFSHDEGHYSVVVGLDENNIYLQDPELGHIRALTRKNFMTVWFDFDEEYIKSKKDIILRRIIIIKKL
ncbi:MAG: cysteine peptidase family C39 domain-containing protein [Candidatus Woesearchaeota archaeon]